MFCPHCGAEIAGTGKFCPKCGRRLPGARSAGDKRAGMGGAGGEFVGARSEASANGALAGVPVSSGAKEARPRRGRRGARAFAAVTVAVLVAALCAGGAFWWLARPKPMYVLTGVAFWQNSMPAGEDPVWVATTSMEYDLDEGGAAVEQRSYADGALYWVQENYVDERGYVTGWKTTYLDGSTEDKPDARPGELVEYDVLGRMVRSDSPDAMACSYEYGLDGSMGTTASWEGWSAKNSFDGSRRWVSGSYSDSQNGLEYEVESDFRWIEEGEVAQVTYSVRDAAADGELRPLDGFRSWYYYDEHGNVSTIETEIDGAFAYKSELSYELCESPYPALWWARMQEHDGWFAPGSSVYPVYGYATRKDGAGDGQFWDQCADELFAHTAARALGVPEYYPGLGYSIDDPSYWEGAGMATRYIEFYADGEVVAFAECDEDGVPVRSIMMYAPVE